MPHQTAEEHFREMTERIIICVMIPGFITVFCLAIMFFAPTPEEKCEEACRALQKEVKRKFSGVVVDIDTGRGISYRIKTALHRHTTIGMSPSHTSIIKLAVGDSIIKQSGSLVYTVHHGTQVSSMPYYVSAYTTSISSDCNCPLEISTTEAERFFSSVRWFNDSISNVRK